MEHKLPYSNIEDYLMGKLPADEMAHFKNALQHNSNLQEEVDLQSHIMESLKETRHAELKARLDAIPVNTGVVIGTAGKIAAGVSIILTTALTYFYFSANTEELQTVATSAYDLPASAEVFAELPRIPEPLYTESAIFNADAVANAEAEPTNSFSPAKVDGNLVSATTAKANSEGRKAPEISFSKPDLATFEDKDIAQSSLGTKPEANVFNTHQGELEQSVEVSTRASKEYTFHYQFSKGKLFIYGDFSTTPYEILEINRNFKVQHYLYYNNKYFRLKKTQRIIPLIPISSKELIKELEITRSSK